MYDQPENMESNDQPEATESTTTNDTFNIDGKEVTREELEKGYKGYNSLLPDYTKKSQELAEFKKQSEGTDEDKEMREVLRQNGFMTKDSVEEMLNNHKRDTHINEVLKNNPNLNQKLIKTLAETHKDKAVEDVIEMYGISDKTKLNKAKQSGIKGEPFNQSTKKSISSMSDTEYKEYRKSLGIKDGNF